MPATRIDSRTNFFRVRNQHAVIYKHKCFDVLSDEG